MDCVIFFDSQGRLCLSGGEDLGIHCSIIHMNLACHFASDTLTSSEIRESQSPGTIKVGLGIFPDEPRFPGFLSWYGELGNYQVQAVVVRILHALGEQQNMSLVVIS